MRRKLLLLSVLAVFAMVGCGGRFSGPVETRHMGRVDPKDVYGRPLFTIDEQKLRGRERLAVSEDDFRIGPNLYSNRPSPTGR